MIRLITFLTTLLMFTVSCSGGSETETAQVHTPAPTAMDTPISTATVAQPISIPTHVPSTVMASSSAPTPIQMPSTPTPTAIPATTTPGPTQLLNLSSYSTQNIEEWIALAESKMKNRKSRILVAIYPVGDMNKPEKWIVDTDYASGVYREHEVLLSQGEIEFLLGKMDMWIQGDSCVHEQSEALALSDYRTWLEKGADSSFQQALCETTRVVMMAIQPQMRDYETIEDFYYFLLHEMYHALQQDLDNKGECRRKRNKAGINSNSVWMYEGAAHYFATWLVAEKYGKPNYRSQILGDAKQSFEHNRNDKSLGEDTPSPDRTGAAALSLMIEHGMITEESILNGSLFHKCARELEFDHTSLEIQQIKNSWYLIENDNGIFQFREEALTY